MQLPFSDISPFTGQVLLLVAVICLKWLVTRFSPIDTFQFFRFYCTQLAKKVNKVENSDNQRVIAGCLAFVINYLTIIIILWLFQDFIEVLWLWQGLLLFIAIDGFHLSIAGKKLAKTLVANNKYEAKQIVNTYVLRDTETMSVMGLTKAFIEVQILKINQQLLVTCFYYLIAGPLAAISYRLCLEMHYRWNIKQAPYRSFGKPIHLIIQLLQWLPIRLISLLILVTSMKSQTLLIWRLIKKDFFVLNNNILLHCFALVNEVQLAGVAIYQGNKLRRPAFNEQARQPQPSDIIHANLRIKTLLLFLSTTLIFTATATYLAKM